jgi:hypothetical protein
MISAPASAMRETQNALTEFVPESRKRKIEEVDGHPPDDRVRLGMQFNHEGSSISPTTSYRPYSDFPRSSYPSQMPAPATTGRLRQLRSVDEENPSSTVRTAVDVPTLDDLDRPASLPASDRAGAGELDGRGHRPVRGRVRAPHPRVDLFPQIGESSFLLPRNGIHG